MIKDPFFQTQKSKKEKINKEKESITMAFEKNIKSIVHFMAYPGPRLGHSTMLGEAPEKYMMESIEAIIATNYFNGIEVTLVKDPVVRKKLTEVYKKAKLYVTFCAQPVQLINEDKLIEPTDISSIDELERSNALNRLKECMDEAYEIGAKQFCFLSGSDPGSQNGMRDRKMALRSLTLSIKELCKYNREQAKKFKREPMKVTLEMFDRSTDKNMKNQLIGPTSDARIIGEEVRFDAGFEEFGLLYDVSHMHLIVDGFDHEEVDVLRSLKPFLNWAHIGNSVTDKDNPRYGDMHPAMSYPGGNVTPEVLKKYFETLSHINFDGGLGLEVMPYGEELSESVMYNGIAAMKMACAQINVNYAIGDYRFKTRKYLPERLFYKITQNKIDRGEIIKEDAKKRLKRAYPWKGNLIIIAADHPGRYVTSVGEDEIAMGDRQNYLGRIIRSLYHDDVDGIMATPDIMDDLFIIDYMLREAGAKPLLDNKIMIGCTNRSGLAGSTHEMDDRTTAYKVKEIAELGMEGAKMMFRIDLETSQARYSQNTLVECSNIVRECGQYNIIPFVEPLPVKFENGKYHIKNNYVDIIKTIGVATAIGGTSSHKIWLKIPYVENFEQVARSTSNPILLLGGASTGHATDTIISFEKALGAGPNIKGALVGRNMLYPGFDDPLAVTLAVAKIVHEYQTAEESVVYLRNQRGIEMDAIAKPLLEGDGKVKDKNPEK
jgi:DhnA family fructose-bisphosphate aldolase class Ia/sugar phosphate isomerase/epimerase